MFDEDCYHKGFEALDNDFRSGRYYLVSDPLVHNPNDRVIHLQQENKNAYNRRGGSNNNLLVVDDLQPSITNGYHSRRDDRNWRGGCDSRDSAGRTTSTKSRSIDNLDESFYSPKSNDSDRGRKEQISSYEYYKRYGGTSHQPSYGKDRYVDVSSDERNSYGYRPKDSFGSHSNDIRGTRVVPRSVQRVVDEQHVSRAWESKSPGNDPRFGGMSNYGSQGRLANEDVPIDNRHLRYARHPNNNDNYRDVRQIQVERTESSGASNMSTRDYWENRWSSGSSDDRGSFVKSASPSLADHPGRSAGGQNRSNARYLSTDNLMFTDQRPSGNFIQNSKPRLNSRVIYDGTRDAQRSVRSLATSSPAGARNDQQSQVASNEKEFLSRVQQELELQRRNLTGEIDKLLSPMGTELEKTRSPFGSPTSLTNASSSSFNAEKNSFVDTTGPCPVFKAFVDVSDYPPNSVTVGVDHLGNKVIVEASESENPKSHVAMSFTQKLPLPKYADVTSISAKLNRKGIVKIEVPLFFYFPSDHGSKSSVESLGKSFVYEVKTDSRDGSKVMEIVVKPGPDVTLNDVRVEVTEDRQLTVCVERPSSGTDKERRVIKTYSLPNTAILEAIKSKMATDGTLTVSVPITRSRGMN